MMIAATKRTFISTPRRRNRESIWVAIHKAPVAKDRIEIFVQVVFVSLQVTCLDFFKDQIPELRNQNAFFANVINKVI